MPIRFRCAYCNQLMGIARRKAGSVVRCPKCAGEIIVPMPDGTSTPDPEEGTERPGSEAFDDQDFERKLQDIDAKTAKDLPTSAPAKKPSAMPMPAPKPVEQRRGIFLSLSMLFLSISVIVLLLVLVFILGVVIGRNAAGG